MVGAIVATTEEIWRWLAQVQDPEIPVISVVDLGIVRDVEWMNGECIVTVTPTYSGCPATDVISQSIVAALADNGIERCTVRTRLSPAWTTDWLSEEGKQKLKAYGIAPPAYQVIDISRLGRGRPQPQVIACPHCGATSTRCVSQFGSTPCKALYRCDACLEPFDYFKCH